MAYEKTAYPCLGNAGFRCRSAGPDYPTPIPADSVRYWATHGKTGLNANEALLSKNWKSGGPISLVISLLFNGQANYQRGHHNWNGEADFLHAGQYTQDGTGYRKTNDRFYLDTKYGYDLTKKWGLVHGPEPAFAVRAQLQLR